MKGEATVQYLCILNVSIFIKFSKNSLSVLWMLIKLNHLQGVPEKCPFTRRYSAHKRTFFLGHLVGPSICFNFLILEFIFLCKSLACKVTWNQIILMKFLTCQSSDDKNHCKMYLEDDYVLLTSGMMQGW